ncbi:putative ribonuclease H-like domain-containing protein [Tanacetum coccineum]
MLNWSDHECEDEEKGTAQVYGMIAGDDDDAAGMLSGDVSVAAVGICFYGSGGVYLLRIWRNFWISDEVFLDTLPLGIFDTTPRMLKGNLLYDSDKSSDSETTALHPVFQVSSPQAPRPMKPLSPLPFFRPFYAELEEKSTARTYGQTNKPLLLIHFRRPGDNPHKNKDLGIVDSGCSRSMTGNKEKLDDFVKIIGGTILKTALLIWYELQIFKFFNLFSVSQICDTKNKVLFTDKECLVLSKEFQLPENSQVVLRVPRRHNLYCFNLSDIQPERDVTCLLAKVSLDESTKWHRRMARVNFKNMNKLAKHGLVNVLPSKLFTNEHNCVACNKGKQHKASYKAITAVSIISAPLQLLHMNLFGPTSIRSIDHKYYSLVVTDDFSRFTWVFFLGTKDETYGILKDFITFIENQLTKKVKAIRCDNGTEFKNSKLIELCRSKGIRRDYSNARTPQQNGVAERKNRTLIEAARTMLADSKLPTMFWTEAVSTACYVLNRVLVTKPHNKTPYELVSGKVPNISHLKPFGCLVTILNTSDHLGKFEGKADEGFIVGYAAHSKAYRVYNLSSKKIEETLNLRYLEDKPNVQGLGHEWYTRDDSDSECDEQVIVVPSFPSNRFSGPNISAGSIDPAASISAGPAEPFPTVIEPVHADETSLPPEMEDIYHHPSTGIFSSSSYDADFGDAVTNLAPIVAVDPVLTKRVNTIHPQSQILRDLTSPVQTRGTLKKSKFGASAFVSYVHDQQRNNHTDYLHYLFTCFLPQLEPISIAQALNDPDWVEVMQEEMQQFINKKNKRDARGIVVKNKARLVAQGHRQEEGIDYDEVFSPVARIEAIILFLAFASYMGFMVYQMDVKSAFLYGEIDEEVYVTQPKGFEDPHFPKHVYKVVKALYGLHQAPRAWYARLSTFLLKHNYRRGTIDKTLFIKKNSRDIILVQVYVDDIIFGSTKKAWCDEFEVLMKGEFEMSAMGELTFFLGLQVKQKPDGIFISQDKYVQDMLKKFDMESVRTATTPYEASKPKSKDEPDDAVNVHLYRSMIGSLMYLTASRPDIMFAVSACSRHQVTPLTSNLNAVKKIFKYLKGQPKLGLWYPRDSPFVLEAYSDSDYAGSHGDRKSTTGGCQFLGRRLISWQCKKQTIVATSSTEAEYVAAANCCGQVIELFPKVVIHGQCWPSFDVKDYILTVKCLLLVVRKSSLWIGHPSLFITEDTVRSQLQLGDDGGIEDLPIADIYLFMDNLGYHTKEALPDSQPVMQPAYGRNAIKIASLQPGRPGHSEVGDHMPLLAAMLPPVKLHITDEGSHFRPQHCLFFRSHVLILDLLLLQMWKWKTLGGSFHTILPEGRTHIPPVGPTLGGAEDLATLTALSFLVSELCRKVSTLGSEHKGHTSLLFKVVGGRRRAGCVPLIKLAKAAAASDVHVDVSPGPDILPSLPLPIGMSAGVSTSTPAGTSNKGKSPADPSNKGKSPLLEEDPPVRERTFRQREEDRLGEEAARRMYEEEQDELEKEREEMQRKRQQDVLNSAKYYTDSDWTDIMSQVHANQGLTADLLGPDVTEDNFAERMVALIAKRRRDFAAQRFQDKRNKPMTYAQQKAYMRTFVKNQSSTIYTTGWTMKHVKSFSDDQLKTEFDKIRTAVTELKSQNIRRSLKRPGADLEQASSKKSKSTEAPKSDVPADSQQPSVEVPSQKATIEDVEVPSNTASTAQHTGSSPKKVGTRKKRLGRKGVHPSHSTIPIEDGDPEAEHKMCIKYASDVDSASDDDTPVNFFAVVDWELLPTGLGLINVFYRKDNSRKCFTSLREILHLVTRADLMTIYGRVMTFYQDKQAAGVGLVLWGDLKVLMDSPEVNDGSDVWKNQHTWSIQSWKLYSYSGVHVLETVGGLVVHMFVDKKYPLSVNLIERMLDHQLEICHDTVGNELTTAVQLIAFLKKQISDSRRPKVHDCPRLDADFLVADSKFMKVAFGVGFKMIAVPSSGIVTTSRYVVPTGRVKVPAGRYVVPTGKDNVIVSAGRTKVIPAGSTILVLVVLCLLRVDSKVS